MYIIYKFNAWGQRNISFEFLSDETGVPKDEKETRYWLNKAAEQGNEDAKNKLYELNEQDKARQKELLENKKAELEDNKKSILAKLTEIDEKIDGAQNQQEEQHFI